jgi:hypothetical protein
LCGLRFISPPSIDEKMRRHGYHSPTKTVI